MTAQIVYSIWVEGHLERSWIEWFDGLAVVLEPGGTTLITGPMRDQAALYGLLNQLGNLGLVLVAVNRELDELHPAAATVMPPGAGGRGAGPLTDR